MGCDEDLIRKLRDALNEALIYGRAEYAWDLEAEADGLLARGDEALARADAALSPKPPCPLCGHAWGACSHVGGRTERFTDCPADAAT